MTLDIFDKTILAIMIILGILASTIAILVIFGMLIPQIFAEEFLEGVEGVSNITWGLTEEQWEHLEEHDEKEHEEESEDWNGDEENDK